MVKKEGFGPAIIISIKGEEGFMHGLLLGMFLHTEREEEKFI